MIACLGAPAGHMSVICIHTRTPGIRRGSQTLFPDLRDQRKGHLMGCMYSMSYKTCTWFCCALLCRNLPISVLIVCLFVSLLSHFWLIHFFHLHLLYQPYLGLCQAQCVQSHQRQPMSAVAITTCEVQVSAADSQTVPTVANGVLTLTFTLTSENLSLYTTLLLLLVLIQLCSPRCWLRLLSYKV